MVWFRLTGTFNEFKWLGDPLSLDVAIPIKANVNISEGPRDDSKPKRTPEAHVAVTCETSVSAEFEAAIGQETKDFFFHYFPVEPTNVQDEIRQIRSQLASATTNTLNLVRWSLGMSGPSDPLRDVNLFYSLNGNEWGLIERPILFRRTRSFPVGYSHKWHERLTTMIENGETEPIGHDLLREAWESRLRNPRSALVLGVTALEVGLKSCIARLVPESEWLVDNLPSPPIDKMLRDYLPMLLQDRGNLLLFAPPKELVKQVSTLVKHRNTIAHKIPVSPRYQEIWTALEYIELESSLWMIQDLLWLFDLYCGRPHTWNRIRVETQQLLINRNNKKSLPDPEYE